MDFKQKKSTQLRKAGKTYNEISKLLNVPKSTLSYWFKGKEFNAIKKKIYTKTQKKWSKNIIEYNKKRSQSVWQEREKIQQNYAETVGNLSNREFLLIGSALYWAEGYKKTKWCISFCNSDPYMIKIMMFFFRKICQVPEDKFRLYVQIHTRKHERKTKKFWSMITNLPLMQFRKTQIRVSPSSKHKRLTNTLPYGTLHIVIFDKNLVDKIKGWIRGLQKIC